MISAEWRNRFVILAMSLFVVWHTLALVVAPAPNTLITGRVRAVMQPYLSLLKLDNTWSFYAPEVVGWRQLRYVIGDRAGQSHSFTPTDELSSFNPNFWWFRGWYDAIMDDPEHLAGRAAELLCRQHAALDPVSITLQQVEVEESLTPDDYLQGRRPTDPGAARTTTLKQVPCKP